MNLLKILGLIVLGIVVIAGVVTAVSGDGGSDLDQSRVPDLLEFDAVLAGDIGALEAAEVLWEGNVTLTEGETFTVTPKYPSGNKDSYTFNRTTALGALDAASAASGIPYELWDTEDTLDGVFLYEVNGTKFYLEGDDIRYQWWFTFDHSLYRNYYLNDLEVKNGETVSVVYAKSERNLEDQKFYIKSVLYSVIIRVSVDTEPTPTPTPTPTPVIPSTEVMLSLGWNFVSTPKYLAEGYNTAAIFSGVGTGGRSIYTYEPDTGFVPLAESDLIRPLDGIWVYANSTTTVPLTYNANPLQAPPTKALSAGWNAIGCTDSEEIAVADALVSVRDRWSHLIGFDAAEQAYEAAILSGGTGTLTPTRGYWVFMTDEGTLAAVSA